MATVTNIFEYQQKDIGEALAKLTEQWRAGELKGFVFACKMAGDKQHGIGLTGDYRRDPFEVLGVMSRIEFVINRIIEGRQQPKREQL
ncbi:hypothetical protein ABIC89_001031 [Variovorax boronicumulans]|uniref:hypothetical protein n=1 Tax=Variovorax boronicumulans TaxID=436515 RepID=UPI003398E7ED